MQTSTSPGYNAAGPAASLALRHGGTAQVRQALLVARRRTLALADRVADVLGPQPHVPYAPERNPPLWELGHVAWFQEWWIARNRQRERGVACDPDAPRRPSLLAQADAWYDSSRVAHRTRWELPLPDAAATRAYLADTLGSTLEALDALAADAGPDALYFFRLVAAHEQMHAEAAVYMAEGLGIDSGETARALATDDDRELALPAQAFRLGSDGSGFAFDNELAAREVSVPALRIDAAAVSWRRFLPFVEDGGYEDARWWSEAGAAWLAREGHRVPERLRRGSEGWEARRQGAWQPLSLDDAAVHLTAHEAEAWCRWAGRRLPTEAEWECAALTLPGLRWGSVWEWTASAFEPYPGFVAHPYRDYSQPWFGTRRVLRGASAATAPALVHARYRNFFEPQRADVFAGFRSCAD